MKLLIAFLGGALTAGTVAFLLVNRASTREIPPPAPIVAALPAAIPAPEIAPAPMEATKPASAPKVARKKPVALAPAASEPISQPLPEVAKAEPQPPQEPAAEPPPPASKKPEPEMPQLMKPDSLEMKRAREERTAQTVTIPAGTVLNVRLNQPLSSERNENGDSFSATLTDPLVINGFVIAERGARIDGRVVDAIRAGRVKGLAQLTMRLTTVHTSDNQRIAILTNDFVHQASTSRGSDAAKMGAGAGIGAALGAIFGGGKGAAIGAAAGGAAGSGAVLMTRGRAAELDIESRIPFRLREPVTVTENLR